MGAQGAHEALDVAERRAQLVRVGGQDLVPHADRPQRGLAVERGGENRVRIGQKDRAPATGLDPEAIRPPTLRGRASLVLRRRALRGFAGQVGCDAVVVGHAAGTR
jgi:hypothetical protein